MKCFGILAILFLVSTAGATNKTNVFTCTYVQREGQWNFLAVSYRMEPIDRPPGETVFTTGMWTEQAAPGFPNHALCGTTMGTEDDSCKPNPLPQFDPMPIATGKETMCNSLRRNRC